MYSHDIIPPQNPNYFGLDHHFLPLSDSHNPRNQLQQVWGHRWGSMVISVQWELQGPKMEVLYHVRLVRLYFVAIFREVKPLYRPYIP